MLRGGEGSVLPQPGPLEDLPLELDVRRVEVGHEARVLHELLGREPQLRRRLEAHEVDEVDGAGARHEVDGGQEDERKGVKHDIEGVHGVDYRIKCAELIGGETEDFKQRDGEGRQQHHGDEVVEEVLVAELQVLSHGHGYVTRRGT